MSPPAEAVAAMTGQPVRSATACGSIWLVTLDGGATVVAKRGEPGQALAEAAGLRWLRVPDGPPLPQVHGHDERWLVTEYVPAGRLDGAGAERFGRQLAALHGAGAPAFGAAPPGGPERAWIGGAPMVNLTQTQWPQTQWPQTQWPQTQWPQTQWPQTQWPQTQWPQTQWPQTQWPQWYAEHRVLPYLRLAVDRQALDSPGATTIQRACDRIDELAGPAESPARLHGDLWSGNVHAGADGRTWLLDPAAHGGHRETDLAMLTLFGYPHLERVLAGYHESAPLASGWRRRVPLHQLFPLLVHAVLFGGGYGARAAAAARAALG